MSPVYTGSLRTQSDKDLSPKMLQGQDYQRVPWSGNWGKGPFDHKRRRQLFRIFDTLLPTCLHFFSTKGQLISKCPFGQKTSSKKPTKLFLDFCPEIFCSFLGASWKLLGASCRLPYVWYYLLCPQEAQKASRKPPGRYKKFQGRNPELISLVFWKKFSDQKDILKLTDL